jgi:hypothetical protein
MLGHLRSGVDWIVDDDDDDGDGDDDSWKQGAG